MFIETERGIVIFKLHATMQSYDSMHLVILSVFPAFNTTNFIDKLNAVIIRPLLIIRVEYLVDGAINNTTSI
jgi:hypothetical protein